MVCFRDEDSQRAWRLDPEHLEVQALGRNVFYDRYRIVICEKVREHGWVHDAHPDDDDNDDRPHGQGGER